MYTGCFLPGLQIVDTIGKYSFAALVYSFYILDTVNIAGEISVYDKKVCIEARAQGTDFIVQPKDTSRV